LELATIRRATTADAATCLAIYRSLVEATAVSFEEVIPTVEEFAARIDKSLSAWTWLIAERDGHCIGYAYGHSHRERAAYRWSVEVTIYVDSTHRRQGVGRQLMSSCSLSLQVWAIAMPTLELRSRTNWPCIAASALSTSAHFDPWTGSSIDGTTLHGSSASFVKRH
jgi:GNAT superfamily N-acetyltransferase